MKQMKPKPWYRVRNIFLVILFAIVVVDAGLSVGLRRYRESRSTRAIAQQQTRGPIVQGERADALLSGAVVVERAGRHVRVGGSAHPQIAIAVVEGDSARPIRRRSRTDPR